MLKTLKILLLTLWLQVGVVWAGYVEEADAAMAKKDYATALKKYRLAAAKKNAYAQYKIGNRYSVGLGVKKKSHRSGTLVQVGCDARKCRCAIEPCDYV